MWVVYSLYLGLNLLNFARRITHLILVLKAVTVQNKSQ